MNNSCGGHARTISVRKKIAFTGAVTVLASVTGTAALSRFGRGITPAVSPPNAALPHYAGAEWADRYWQEHGQSAKMCFEPYTHWRRRPVRGSYVNVDERGRRATWTPPGATNLPTLHVYGGSTVWGTGSPDNETLPSHIARGLYDRGQPHRVINCGESGYVSSQDVIRFMLDLRKGDRPRVAVFYGGYNDAFSAWQNHAAGLPQNIYELRRESPPDWNPPHDPASLGANAARVWLENMRMAETIGAGYGVRVLAVWQPCALLGKQLTDAEAARLHDTDMIELYRAADAAIKQTSTLGVSGVFRGSRESLYIDTCHVTPAGNAIIAAMIVPHIEKD